jgi:hypothetical protein
LGRAARDPLLGGGDVLVLGGGDVLEDFLVVLLDDTEPPIQVPHPSGEVLELHQSPEELRLEL